MYATLQVAVFFFFFREPWSTLLHEYKDYTRALLGRGGVQPEPSIWIDLGASWKPDCSVPSLVFIGCD